MRNELERSRRLLVVTYRRYVEAELCWVRARQAAQSWFPQTNRPYRWTIGTPHSPMRQVYENRQRALLQFAAARRKFREAKVRMERRPRVIALLPCSPGGQGA
ncbi:MAG: hypothetical protein RIG84_10220 [Roseovarius sp.]